YTALSTLGPAYTFRTDVLADGEIAGNELRGNLVFRGGGDPKLVIENFWLLVEKVRAYGLQRIQGDVLLDRTAFASGDDDPAIDGRDDGRAYEVGPDPLLLNFKAVGFTFIPEPRAGRARIVVVPEIAGMNTPASIALGDRPCAAWRSAVRADFSVPLAPKFTGSFPRDCAERAIYMGALSHDAYFGGVFRALWEREGGRWSGRVRSAATPPAAALLASLESAPLAALIRDSNKFSNNVMTRQIYLTIGATRFGAPGDTDKAERATRQFLASRGLAMSELRIENGSGLSPRERISADSLAALLRDAYYSKVMPELMTSLPIAGVDGTMRTRRVAAGSAHIKTGMLTGVRAIAGYVLARSGHRYAVVAIINHRNAGSAQRVHDALLDWVYDNG
ncbi:MAG: D-alanyl-D-alanine carboxypeptidase/D-alanyl-D-alanine-endopeptidase, partial [Steroidobacteraceae bacterium]